MIVLAKFLKKTPAIRFDSPMNWDWRVMEGDQGSNLWGAEEPEADQGQQAMDLELESNNSRGLGGVLDFLWENPIGITIIPASLCPPTLAAASSCSWALLDLKAYIADRANATTAKDFTRAGHQIQAMLCLASPPLVSHLCVHCTSLTPADFGTEPAILAHCDGFIFFKAAICNTSVCFEPCLQDFFVYWAPLSRMEGRPSLTRLPHPGPSCNITSSMVWLALCAAVLKVTRATTALVNKTMSLLRSDVPKAVETTHNSISTASTPEKVSGPPRCCSSVL
jgi:hypothetical protein